ncbi:MAG: aspartate kinase [Halomonas sp.]
MTRVFKFGGASIHDAAAIRHLGELLAGVPERPLVVVVSAMGKTTNALEALIAAARRDDETDYRRRFDALRQAHLDVLAELFGAGEGPEARIRALFDELDDRHRQHRDACYPLHYDQTIGYGELLSTTLVAAWLDTTGVATTWCDARELIITDACHQAANIDWAATRERVAALDLEAQRVLLTQGFIGATPTGAMSSLGREGSDFSAAILAHCLEAEEVVIWKDVPGVFNADPRRFDNAVPLAHLSYAEAVELAWHGAKVIHPKTLGPLQQRGIALTVRSFLEPEATSTTIDADTTHDAAHPAFILRDDQVLLEITPRDFAFMDEARLHDILGRLVDVGLHANLIDSEAMRLRLSVDPTPEQLDPLADSLAADYRLERREGLTLLTVRHPTPALLETLGEGREVIAERGNAATAQRLFRRDECPETWHIPD